MDAATRQGLEALLFLADEPVTPEELAEVLEVEPDEADSACAHLAERYADEGRGIEIRQAAGGWRMYSAPGARAFLERWALSGRTGRLTQAALETLAVVAYKQPISRQDIGDIRGVNADGAVRSLVARGFVEEVGRDEGPGQAVLYGTTGLFLERLGVDGLDDLPPITDFLPEAPAPDEPELGAIREARRRLAEAGAATVAPDPGAPGGSGSGEDEDDALPAPAARAGGGGQGDMDELTDRLDRAARSAVDRLRQAVSAAESEQAAEDESEAEDAAATEGASEAGDGAATEAGDDAPEPEGDGADGAGERRAGDRPGGGGAVPSDARGGQDEEATGG